MKRCIFIILLFLAFNSYAQKTVPCNSGIEDFLLSYLIKTKDISEEFINAVKQPGPQTKEDDCIEVFSEPILVKNLLTENFVTFEDLLTSDGIFTFYCPLILPFRFHILLKQQEDIVIVEQYGYEEDVTHKHREVLVNFFYDHPELTSSDFTIYETFINDADRYNSTYLE